MDADERTQDVSDMNELNTLDATERYRLAMCDLYVVERTYATCGIRTGFDVECDEVDKAHREREAMMEEHKAAWNART